MLSLFFPVTSQHGRRDIFDRNFDTRDLNFASHVPRFYRNILTVWQELHSKNPSTVKDYQNETIWNDRFIRIDGRPVFYSSWYEKGVIKIHYLLNKSRNFLLRSKFQQNYGVCYDKLSKSSSRTI